MRIPANSPETLAFGSTSNPYSAASPHMGTDFAYIPDNRIYAPFAGTVALIPNNGRDGNGLYMYNGGQFHGMLHSSQYLVANGQHVEEGQPIAIMGDTGFAQGVHLHWCVKVNGQFVDPMTLVTKENQPMLEKEVKSAFTVVLHRDPKTEAEWQKWVGRSFQDFADEMAAGPEWRLQNDIVLKRYPNDEDVIKQLREQVAQASDTDLQKKLDAIKAILN